MTIDEIYAAINPLPALLSAKGLVRPSVDFRIEANAGVSITMKYNDWEQHFECFLGNTFDQALSKAVAHIQELPTAEQAKLNNFMGKLGKLIDVGKDDGIEIAYLNPLLESMKKLSENVITYKPAVRA